MSSTADARRGTPARTLGDPPAPHARVRAPRPWTASLQRPAAKILVAGGLTLAGWLLGGALSGSTASAADRPACPEAPVVSTVDHAAKPLWHARHRRSHQEPSTCAAQPKADSTDAPAADGPATTPETTASETTESKTAASKTTKDSAKATSAESTSSETPKATSSSGNLLGSLVGGTLQTVTGTTSALTGTTTKDTSGAPAEATPSGGLVGGLVGGVLNVVGGTLTTVTDTLGTVTDTLSHTVLAPLTQPPAGNPNAPVLLPLDDILNPVLGGSSNAGGVTAVVPGVTAVVTQAPAAVTETVPVTAATAADEQQTYRAGVAHLVVRHAGALAAVHEQPRDSGTHATGGGDSTPGLPGGTTAPSAPATTAAPGHDGSGGARHAFAVHTDDVTTTQLKLIGTSRDHEVDGAGREAALPTTSPD